MEKNQATKKDNARGRTRNWTFVLYPESAPINWRDVLNELHVPWVESPLHNKDVEEDGASKKEHWHILLMFESVKTFEQIKEITDSLNAPIPQKCASPKGLVRYMLHLDNPDKFQYNRSDIVAYAGADVAYLLKPTSSSRYELIKEMMEYIEINDVTEMKELLLYAGSHRFDDWFPLLCDNSAYIIGQFVKSNRHGRDATVKVVKVNQDGEII